MALLLTRLLICLGLLFPNNIIADNHDLEYKVKAGYLYNFTKFVSWSQLDSATFNLCLLGNDPFGSDIDPIEKKSVSSHPIKIIRLSLKSFFSSSNSCHILYTNDAIKPKTIIDTIQNRQSKITTLVVGESDNFASQGGMIGFITRNGKIKLQINLQSVNRTKLKISAKLLEIAELIKAENHD